MSTLQERERPRPPQGSREMGGPRGARGTRPSPTQASLDKGRRGDSHRPGLVHKGREALREWLATPGPPSPWISRP
jgi:hypothetical protein